MASTHFEARPLWASLVVFFVLFSAHPAHAEDEKAERKAPCTEHCFTLGRLIIRGDVAKPPLTFELEGTVHADEAVAVPLFGPPGQVRIDHATENGHAAAISFDDKHYFFITGARHFVLRGQLTMLGDPTLTIGGPLNALDTELTGGRLVEGARLSGLSDTVIHFETGAPILTEEPGPTVFQLARALRIRREIAFEYQLTMRSGKDLGVVRLPLVAGEKVLAVTGSNGWKVDEHEISLPTSGLTAKITVSGTLSSVDRFTPDARSTYEWWLVESDAEHRVSVGGDAAQVDSGQSPIAAAEQGSRLFLMKRGQHVDLSVQSLESAEVLATVVRRQARNVTVTTTGDMVSDEELQYENSGLDYLTYAPTGQALYLASDGVAQRIMLKNKGLPSILVPLKAGVHSARVQTLSHAQLGWFAGSLAFPMQSHPLATSNATLTLGLPSRVHPVALLGGDHARWFIGMRDFAACAIALGMVLVAVRARRVRVLAFGALVGLWILASSAFIVVTILAASAGAAFVAWSLTTGNRLRFACAVAIAGMAVVAGRSALRLESDDFSTNGDGTAVSKAWVGGGREEGSMGNGGFGSSSPNAPTAPWGRESALREAAEFGMIGLLNAPDGVREGMRPVAITLPSSERTVTASRDLVTGERPFRPTLYYVTDGALVLVLGGWLACLGGLAFAYRAQLSWLRDRLRRSRGGEAELDPKEAYFPG